MASSDEEHPWRGKIFKGEHVVKNVNFEVWNQAQAKYLGEWLHAVEEQISSTKYTLSENQLRLIADVQEYGRHGESHHVAAAPCFHLAVEVHTRRQRFYQAKSVRIRSFWYFFFSSSSAMSASIVAWHANLDLKLIVFEKHTGRQEKSKTRKRTRSQARTSCQPCRDTSCSKGSCCRCGTAMKNAPREFLWHG